MLPHKQILLAGLVIAFVLLANIASVFGQTKPATDVLAVVNGENITRGDLEFLFLSRRIPPDQQQAVWKPFLEILIERQLMREFLASRKAKPSQAELEEQVARVIKVIRDGGDDPDQLLAKMGMTRETLREELALPLTWKSYLRLVVSQQRLREYYEKHRSQFDGTKVRVSQIFLKLPKDADATATQSAEMKLREIKTEIESGKLSFAEAAKSHSEAPSQEKGGDTGWVTYRGRLPAAVSDAAFALKEGEISDPVRSPFGMHLITVTERQPGDLSLEDVRASVFNQLARELWQETVKAQREKAKIEIR